jgi:hypothetical protein
MNPDIDTNIDSYSVEEILTILNIIDPTVFNVTDATNSFIAKMKETGNTELEIFFGKARDKVLTYLQTQRTEPVENETTEEINNVWYSNIEKKEKDKVYYFDETHIVAEEKSETAQSAGPPILATHLVVIDSQFRSNILPYLNNPQSNAFNTSFTFNLTSQIHNAVSLKLYSYHIPTTWNAFSSQLGNTFFIYNGIIITIPDGNYSPTELRDTINTLAQQNVATAGLLVNYDTAPGGGGLRFSLTNTDPLIDTVTVTFLIGANTVNFTNCGTFSLSDFQTLGVNTTLGWLLGFRTLADTVTGNVDLFLLPEVKTYAEAAAQTYGPKYFTLSVEDYSNQRLSGGLYNILNTKTYTNLSAQDYYNNVDIACKLREGSLTQAQLYAINAISTPVTTNSVTNTMSGYTSNSAFAVIPLDGIAQLRPNPYIKFGEDLAINTRNYSAPTSLERFSVSLKDDKGNLVNLYDSDWSFSVIVEERLN